MAQHAESAAVHAVAGAIGGCVATVATYPLMSSAARAQARKRHAESDATHMQDTQRDLPLLQSLRARYTGLSASLFGTTVSQGVYFYFYSLLRSFFIGRRTAEAPSVVESLGIASLAGMANVLLTNPIWVVATRLQTTSTRHQGDSVGSTNNNNKKNNDTTTPQQGQKGPARRRASRSHSALRVSNLAVIKSVYADYGIPGFWNGCGASLIMVINPTIQYAMYEWLMA